MQLSCRRVCGCTAVDSSAVRATNTHAQVEGRYSCILHTAATTALYTSGLQMAKLQYLLCNFASATALALEPTLMLDQVYGKVTAKCSTGPTQWQLSPCLFLSHSSHLNGHRCRHYSIMNQACGDLLCVLIFLCALVSSSTAVQMDMIARLDKKA